MMSNVTCFYKLDGENGYLSNWYPSQFTIDGIEFSSLEKYMMYQKAITFSDEQSAKLILNSNSPSRIKSLGRGVKNFNDVIWNGLRQPLVYRGLLEKFRQNEDLKQMLLSTGEDILAECSARDRIWGIGLGIDNIKRCDLSAWRGKNLLGFTLMAVRTELRNNG